MLSKDELELLIAEEREIGDFLLDEEKNQFTTDAEVCYEIVKIDENTFKSGEFIYFDECEYLIEEHEKRIFKGTLEEVQEQISEWYSEENSFMGYPVVYTNLWVKLVD